MSAVYSIRETLEEKIRPELAVVLQKIDTPENREKFLGDEERHIRSRDLSRELIEKIESYCGIIESSQKVARQIKDGLSSERVLATYRAIQHEALTEFVLDDLEKSRLQEEADKDPLTGLYNVSRFERDLEGKVQALQVGARRSTDREKGDRITDPGDFTLLFLDLDRFKKLNDTYGHIAGNEVLEEMGILLESFSNEHAYHILMEGSTSETSYRPGGEEFAIIINGDSQKGEALAYDLLELVRAVEVVTGEKTIGVTASIGVVHYSPEIQLDCEPGKEARALMKVADKMLYKAKDNGRDRVEIYQPKILVAESP